MDRKKMLQSEIDLLSGAIENALNDIELYIERGKLYYKLGHLDKAMNDFIWVRELSPEHDEAHQYIVMISDILNFRYAEIYNP